MRAELAVAEAALARGDYGQCLAWLQPLADRYPLPSNEGAEIRMLMITAWMGQGDEQKALDTCRLLSRCPDPDLRQNAKQLLSVLEAPSLERPANWSIQLPALDLNPMTGNGQAISRQRQRKKPEGPPPPPTGPTRAPSMGFAALVMVVLIGLTLLLSGCVRLTADVGLPGPDRVELSWQLQSSTQRLLPWQLRFEQELATSTPKLQIIDDADGTQLIQAPVLSSKQANTLLQGVMAAAARAGGLELAPPVLTLAERNWLIGIQQDLSLAIDLSELPEVPGLQLAVRIKPAPQRRAAETSPLPAIRDGAQLNWVLQPGEINRLESHGWRWSGLGLGAILVMVLLAMTLILQGMRLKLGFGFPELPS
ncbi:MAG: DUF3153 domain-containing protein [Prochlorococcus sp.]|nr:DUF3153 domain-containing protein [Prochlorococcaceae cyanobacterium Fu_MAG_50]